VVPTISFNLLYVLAIISAGPARACLDRCDRAPDGGMDRAANY
jgi:hypothetical protein